MRLFSPNRLDPLMQGMQKTGSISLAKRSGACHYSAHTAKLRQQIAGGQSRADGGIGEFVSSRAENPGAVF